MKYLFFSVLFLASCSVKTLDLDSETAMTALTQCWKISYEDKTDEDIDIYRPCSYNFPPSRGREGLHLKEDGTFIYSQIAPADGFENLSGTWTKDGSILTLTYTQPESRIETREIISLTSEVLRLK